MTINKNTQYKELVEKLTGEEILSRFPDIIPIEKRPNSKSSDLTSSSSSSSSTNDNKAFHGHDEEQIKLMNENCIVIDYNDNIIGTSTKKNCHLLENIEKGLLHRAFSCFIFDSNNNLLLQKRAREKITFPLLWTNTCCSHPLSIDDEIGSISNKNLSKNITAVQNASIRKLDHELGIPQDEIINNGKFHFLNRIHYMSPCFDKGNDWGEHEIDYILIYKIDHGKKITINGNPNEIDDYKWVNLTQFKEMLSDNKNYQFTPWFKIICDNYLFDWWNQLDDLSKVENDPKIYRML